MAGQHPFAELIDLHVAEVRPGTSRLVLDAGQRHLNPHQVVHGAVLYAMADTGMGAALYPTLAEGEICATIEIKISYFKPVRPGPVVCETTLVNRGKAVANLESRLTQHGVLVAAANGHYAIFKAPGVTPRPPQPGAPDAG
jgi:acyl-CoA thioesterase